MNATRRRFLMTALSSGAVGAAVRSTAEGPVPQRSAPRPTWNAQRTLCQTRRDS